MYEINLPDQRTRFYPMVTFFMLLINTFMFGYLLSRASDDVKGYSLIKIGFILGLVSLVFFAVQRYRKILLSYKPEIAFIIMALTWFFLGAFWQGLLMLLVAVMGLISSRKQVLLISQEGIQLPGLRAKKIAWADVSNIVIKDAILTIDLKDNRLIQLLLDANDRSRINEEAFNAFCRSKLNY